MKASLLKFFKKRRNNEATGGTEPQFEPGQELRAVPPTDFNQLHKDLGLRRTRAVHFWEITQGTLVVVEATTIIDERVELSNQMPKI